VKFNEGFEDAGIHLVHHFGGGVYAKETRIPAGVALEQHVHPFDHLSILASGRAKIVAGEEFMLRDGPAVLLIRKGIKHKVHAITDITWLCVHATEETDPEKIDHVLVGE
jgi:quercetin dioxygenase-like cupin family protein